MVAVAAYATWAFTQAGMQTAEIRIVNSSLYEGADGPVRGRLAWRVSEPSADPKDNGTTVYSDFVCSIANLDQPALLKIKPDNRFRVRYRARDIGPFGKQNQFDMFITDSLGIDREFIIGYTLLSDITQIVITGNGPAK